MTNPERLVLVTVDGALDAEPEVERIPWTVDDGPVSADAMRDEIERSGAAVVAMWHDVPDELALATARLLDEAIVPTGVVLVRTPTAELWREAARVGVREIIDPASGLGELRRAVRFESERIHHARAARNDLLVAQAAPDARIIVVLSPKGGSGKTMFSSNLAVSLAITDPSEVALVDLDCGFGDVAGVLGLVPERTIGQLAMLPKIDSATVKVFLTRHAPSGLFVLAGSGLPEEGEAVTAPIATQVITTLAHDVRHVIIDTAAGLDELALAAIDIATDLVLIATLDVASVRNLGKEIDALDRIGATSARRHFVLNRADARVALDVADVEAAIGMRSSIALPSSRSVPMSMNQGHPIVLDEPDSPVTRQLLSLAREFVDVDPETSNERRRFFRRR